MSTVTRKPSNFFTLVISVTADINLPLSPICLFLTFAICCEEIKSGRIFLVSQKELLIFFKSTFNKEMGLQCCLSLLSVSFFSC